MKSLVVYDSNFGNTKIVAEAIAKGLGEGTQAVLVSDFNPSQLEGVELLVVGSPINGWRPSEKTIEFLSKLDKSKLNGMKATSFDTRITMFLHGDAMGKIAKELKNSGAEIVSPPKSFNVDGTEGPLKRGEEENAVKWGEELKKLL